MPWCHHCKTEFVDGVSLCSDCGAFLEMYPPGEPEPVRCEGSVEPVLLCTTTDTLEADQLEALLRSEGILAVRRYRGAGQYLRVYAGRSRVEVGLFVHPDRLEDAADLLGAMALNEEEIPVDELQDNASWYTFRRLGGWLLLVIFVFTTVVLASGQITLFIRLLLDMLQQQ